MAGPTPRSPRLDPVAARPPAASLGLRAKHLLLSRDPRQQVRLAHSGLAILLMVACVVMLHVLDAAGYADGRWVWPWTAAALTGMVSVFVLIRSGRVLHWRDPSLTMVQMLFAVLCTVAGYCITGAARSVAIPMLAVALMFGMFGMSQRQVRIVGGFTLLLFGLASLWWLCGPERGDPPGAELVRFMMVGTVVGGVVALTERLHGMRERWREERQHLASALDRARQRDTRDELTGCLNRRAMLERMAEESLRSARLGQPMCLVLLDLDHFRRVNDRLGHAAGDLVLRGFADLARARRRDTDLLSRWGGEEFLMVLGATDAVQARTRVQRLLEELAERPFEEGVKVTCSAGLTECRGGESIVAAIERADRALVRAKAAGRNRLEQA